MPNERFRADAALAPLKVFQRRTVDYVFDRLYGQDDPVRQFLVADEVGLGKTMVARGVIARMIEHLWDSTKRIDILYICSNQAIAAQNLNRLNVLGRRELALPTRMTLVALQLRDQAGLDANRVNFISLTPGTTFDLRSATGVTQERALLFHLLRDLVTRPRGLHNLLQVTAGVEGWNRAVDNLTLEGVDKRIIERFRRDVQADRDIFEELERICELFPRRRDTYPAEMTQPRNSLVARLRAKLSHACVDALQPDLIIMDEFQRFRDLLHGDSDAAILARELFDYSGGDGHAARTLLLSATPYRMLTLAGDEPDEGDHYQDFLETLSFLYGREKGPEVAATLAREMRAFRGLLHALPQSHASAVETRQTIERRLRRVIARTERVASTRDGQMQIVDAVGFLDRLDLRLERRQFPLHPGDLLTRGRRLAAALSPLGGGKLVFGCRRAQRAGKHDREIVLADHQIGGFDLPHGRHLTQNVEHLHRARRVFQHLGRLGADPFQQPETPQH